jgi:hypothetical protein
VVTPGDEWAYTLYLTLNSCGRSPDRGVDQEPSHLLRGVYQGFKTFTQGRKSGAKPFTQECLPDSRHSLRGVNQEPSHLLRGVYQDSRHSLRGVNQD